MGDHFRASPAQRIFESDSLLALAIGLGRDQTLLGVLTEARNVELVVALSREEHVHLIGRLLLRSERLIAVAAIIAVVFLLFHHYVQVLGLLLYHWLGRKLGGG